MVYPRSHSSLSFYYTSFVTQNAVWINSQKAEGNIFADSLQMCLLTHPNSQRLLSLHVTLDQEWAQTPQREVTVIAMALAIRTVLVALKLPSNPTSFPFFFDE